MLLLYKDWVFIHYFSNLSLLLAQDMRQGLDVEGSTRPARAFGRYDRLHSKDGPQRGYQEQLQWEETL